MRWTKTEESFLIDNLFIHYLDLAEKLNRTPKSVLGKIKHFYKKLNLDMKDMLFDKELLT
jgi:hypothetical protein